VVDALATLAARLSTILCTSPALSSGVTPPLCAEGIGCGDRSCPVIGSVDSRYPERGSAMQGA